MNVSRIENVTLIACTVHVKRQLNWQKNIMCKFVKSGHKLIVFSVAI